MSSLFKRAVMVSSLPVFVVSLQFADTVDKQEIFPELVANIIRNAIFIERTPEFTDLYIIETQDKGRDIVIYCNSSYCYKQGRDVLA